MGASRPGWKGSISFGLVTVPIRLHKAADKGDVTFNQLHTADGGRISYRKVCSDCGQEVGADEIAKGYPLDGGYVVIEKDDLDTLPVGSKKIVLIEQFVPAEQIDPVMFTGETYYVEPEEAGTRGYVLILRALEEQRKVAIGKVTFREKERIVAIRPTSNGLALERLYWPGEVRSFRTLDTKQVQVRREELSMAKQLVDSMTTDFDPERFVDEYRTKLMERIEAKAAGKPVENVIEMPKAKDQAADLMAALKASVDQNKKPAKKRTATKRRVS